MSSLNAPLSLRLEPSRTGFLAVLAAHGVVAIAIALSSPPPGLQLAAIGLWSVSLAWAVRERKQLPGQVNGIVHRESGWQLGVAEALQPATLTSAFITQPAMVLRFRITATGKTARVVVWQDSANADDIRRLRVRLLHPAQA